VSAEIIVLLVLGIAFGGGFFLLGRRINGLRDAIEHATKENRGLADNVIRQIEALDIVRRELDLSGGLPLSRGWAASPDLLLEITRYARNHPPQTMLECGAGLSTVVLAAIARKNGTGHVYSLENDPAYAAQVRRDLSRVGLDAWASVIDAPLDKFAIGDQSWRWYTTATLPNAIDLLLVDGPPGGLAELARYPAGPLLFPRLSATGIVFCDDSRRTDEQAVIRRWLSEFPNLMAEYLDCEKGCAVLRREAA
jgi:predicted O-methyltransferase YrrM